jgi:lipoyl-dependent peroxiredoxin
LISGKQNADDFETTSKGEEMATERKATVTWRGDLMSGSGEIDEVSSGAIRDLDVTWKARSEEPGGMTSPEELIAAAHATCFSMALSNGLAKDGHAPEQLDTSATVTFQPPEGITKIALAVEGRVPGMDDDQFQRAAEEAKENCPVSKALASVPEITLEARLA